MKAKWLHSMLLLLFLQATVFAQQPVSSTATRAAPNLKRSHQTDTSTITTRQGVTYRGVTVQRVDPDGVVIDYKLTGGGDGISKLKFENLPADWQRRYGYNPTNAVAYEKKQGEVAAKWRAELLAGEEKAELKRHADEVAEAAREARITGTGFFITDDGCLLTCYHVVASATQIMVGTKQGVLPAELVKSAPARDIALLKVKGTFAAIPLASSNSISLGQSVFTVGFPDPELQGLEPKLTRGEISSLAGVRDDPNEYQISVPVQPGNSGGALLDDYGNVVGIVAARISDRTAFLISGMIPQNVNYAVKSSCARILLGSIPGLSLKLKPPYPPKERKPVEVVKEARDAVALVLVN